MGHRRRRRSNRRYERKIEHRQWFTKSGTYQGNATLKAGADTDNIVKLVVDPLKGDDQTILRTRGHIVVGVNAADTVIKCALGGIVLPNKTATNASTSDLPNPLVDTDSTDWFVWHPFIAGALITGGTGNDNDEDQFTSQTILPVDSKAKRIMEASESVVWILGLNPEQATSAKEVQFHYILRTLVGY